MLRLDPDGKVDPSIPSANALGIALQRDDNILGATEVTFNSTANDGSIDSSLHPPARSFPFAIAEQPDGN